MPVLVEIVVVLLLLCFFFFWTTAAVRIRSDRTRSEAFFLFMAFFFLNIMDEDDGNGRDIRYWLFVFSAGAFFFWGFLQVFPPLPSAAELA